MRRHSKGFRFADEMVSIDVIISIVLGIISIGITLGVVIYGIITKGAATDTAGAVLLAGVLSGFTGLVFSLLTLKESVGSARSKRAAITICVISMVLVVLVFLCR